MAAHACAEARGNFVSRGGNSDRAQGRLFARHDARDGQGAGGNAWGHAGSDRYDLPDGRGGKTAIWANHAVGAAEQIRDVRAHARGSGWADLSLEFSDGDSVVEGHAGASDGQYRCDQAGGRYAALDLQFDAGAERSRVAARSDERGFRRWSGGGRATSQ